MISRAVISGKSTILRQIAFGNQQLVRNLFILGLSSVARSHIAGAEQLSNLRPFISDIVPVAMSSSASAAGSVPVVEYNEIKDLPNHPEKLLIDVREPNELQETGVIPTSINIPLGGLKEALAIGRDSKSFQSQYGRQKPDVDTYIIITCRSGRRAETGAKEIQQIGYKNVHNYVGSWLDWAEHENLPKDPAPK